MEGRGLPHPDPGNQVKEGILDGNGDPLLDGVQLNTQLPENSREEIYNIDIDADGTRHMFWHAPVAGDDTLAYTRILSNGVVAVNQLTVTQPMSNWYRASVDVPRMVVDSQGAAHVVWKAKDTNGVYWLFWPRISRDGTLSEERQLSLENYSRSPDGLHAAIDSQDRLHVVMGAHYLSGSYRDLIYGRLDRDGNFLRPFHLVVPWQDYPYHPMISVDDDDRVLILVDRSGGPIYLVSSVPDPAANDTTRADLEVDAAHARRPRQGCPGSRTPAD